MPGVEAQSGPGIPVGVAAVGVSFPNTETSFAFAPGCVTGVRTGFESLTGSPSASVRAFFALTVAGVLLTVT